MAVVLVVLGSVARALAAPTLSLTTAQFGNVLLSTEPAEIQVVVAADAAGFRGTLRVSARDAYGRRAGSMLEALTLAPHAVTTRTFGLRSLNLGHFRVEGALAAAGGGGRVDAATTAAIVPPLLDTDANASAVGYFIYPEDEWLPDARGIAAQMRRVGVRWVRLQYRWWRDRRPVPPERANPEWLDTQAFERWVDAFRAEGIEVLATIFGTARWASSAPDDLDDLTGLPHWGLAAPRDFEDWRLVVRTLAQRFHGRIRYWEVWNEPDLSLFWRSSIGEFVTLVRVAAEAVREVDGDAKIVVNMAPNLPDADPFGAVVLADAGDVIDVIGWHYGHYEVVEAAMRTLPRLRPGAAVWDTEAYGAPRRHVTQWLEERSAGAQRIFPFVYHLRADDAQLEVWHFGRYPVNRDYTPRDEAVALRTLSDMVGNAASLVRDVAGLGYFTYATGGVMALADLNQPGVTWSGPPGVFVTVDMPRAVRSLRVTDLMGNAQAVRVRNGRARIRLLGVAAFLQADPPEALTSLRVVRVRRARR